MKTQPFKLALFLFCLSGSAASIRAGVAYPDPPGGWKYIFNGDKDIAGDDGSGFTSLDGTWSHDNGSDQWDGSKLGGTLSSSTTFGQGNAPGGVMGITEDGVTFLRLQDPGDPRSYNFPDPYSNRKIYFGHDITADGVPDTILDDGVAFTFRVRIPTPKNTKAPIDQLYLSGQAAGGPKPYPDGGDGYLISDGGKGNVGIKQASGGIISFALTVPDDNFDDSNASAPKANFAGLTMNRLNGNQVATAVNFDSPGTFNGLPLDPTAWHEFWVVIRKDPTAIGTHQVFIFADGSKDPSVFTVTAGDGSDFTGISYLAIGGSRTVESWALDLDFIGFKSGLIFPPGALDKPFVAGFAGSPTGFTLTLSDAIAAGGTKVNTNSVAVTMNGQSISPTVAKQDSLTAIIFKSPKLLAAGSTNAVKVTFTDTGTPPQTITAERTFVVQNYPLIAAATALDDTKLDRSKKGFKLHPYGTEENNPNTLAWTEEALAGKHGSNTADLTSADSSGFFTVTDVINFDIGTGAGNFTDANGHPDSPFPGFPGSQSRDGGTGNAIEEVLTLIEIPAAGFYTMGVNSDDGFRVTTGAPDPRPPAPALTLGQFDGGRGSADTLFNFAVEASGVYAFRLIWENGGGGANLEWFSVQSDGKKVLINDATTAAALKAFQFQLLPLKPIAKPGPTISLARAGGQVQLAFTGTLQSADQVTGPWTDEVKAVSPFAVTLDKKQKFYRAKQ